MFRAVLVQNGKPGEASVIASTIPALSILAHLASPRVLIFGRVNKAGPHPQREENHPHAPAPQRLFGCRSKGAAMPTALCQLAPHLTAALRRRDTRHRSGATLPETSGGRQHSRASCAEGLNSGLVHRYTKLRKFDDFRANRRAARLRRLRVESRKQEPLGGSVIGPHANSGPTMIPIRARRHGGAKAKIAVLLADLSSAGSVVNHGSTMSPSRLTGKVTSGHRAYHFCQCEYPFPRRVYSFDSRRSSTP